MGLLALGLVRETFGKIGGMGGGVGCAVCGGGGVGGCFGSVLLGDVG